MPVPAAAARALVLGAVFVCAACGLVYELELVALATSLTGDSVTQASLVLSVMVFAMGCGSLLAKRLRARAAIAFAAVEAVLALVGGLSAMAMYACFAWYGQTRPAVIGCAYAIGLLTGAEVPLLMTLVQRIRRQDAGGAVADLFAADYVGALAGGLAFPFLLLPHFGQLSGALVTGAVNAVAGSAIVLWLFRDDLSSAARFRLLLVNLLVLALLGTAAATAQPFERAARHAVYGGLVRVVRQSPVQEIVLTGSADDPEGLRLFLDGRLRVCGTAADPYHHALADPALTPAPSRGPQPGDAHRTSAPARTDGFGSVLVLGGGDGLTAHRVLAHPGVRDVTVVDSDPELIRLGRTDPALSALNGRVFADPRVRMVSADPFGWLRDRGPGKPRYDVIVADLPGPGPTASAKLYSEEFFGLAARALAPGGRVAVPAGRSPHTLWTLRATLAAAGLHAVPYATPAPPQGCPLRPPAGTPEPWNFLLAARPGTRLPRLPATPLPRPERGAAPSTLLHPRL
ncbi:spermidine synthase [Streptomyces sp. KK5PA1]|uniref:Polyamine aminopropyltransferase n=1 Tax=Actinacidiphila acididurans TaxID=2784346 RepID=A0ABS2U3P5_9ACTN|nr:spermidine synthase [Actinacidiphila acididurans]